MSRNGTAEKIRFMKIPLKILARNRAWDMLVYNMKGEQKEGDEDNEKEPEGNGKEGTQDGKNAP